MRPRRAATKISRRALTRSARPARSRLVFGRMFFKNLLSFAALAGVGALLVATSLPANAVQSAELEEVAAPAVVEKQSVAVQNAQPISVTRDAYTVTKPPPPPPPKPAYVAQVFGSYSNNQSGAVRWPFPGAPIASGYGPRGGGFHNGIDIFPGDGTPIGSIADGVVTFTGVDAGGWGNYVRVRHSVNGQTIESLYAHMRWGSISVATGQSVAAGQFLGAVGQTGRAYGSHLHLEIKVNGGNVDPYAWMSANAG